MQAPRETDSEPRIGRFRLVRELGRGAMGVVYEAFQDDLQRRVALKVIAPDVLATDAAAGDRFEREARLAASIRHPGVVHVYEVGVAGGRAYLAMEFVEGQPLRPEHPTGGRADPHATAQIALEVARAVAALHQAGIVHRDIKPDNVLIDRDGRARVTDFGLALLRGDRADEHAGTPGFMAPEQLTRRFGEVSERSDVYGIGALLHALLTGRAPHERSVVADTVMATIEQDLPPAIRAPGVPAALSAVCRRCLERRPEQRYPTAAALADDLERWLRGDAPEATPPGR
ncbi:MAG: serine/threonine protein kinase, partial [Planctomycetes bacterium]|nr:serine/threonine protein kinase [Planctomycetota bacterium]